MRDSARGPLGDRFTRHGAGPIVWFSILLIGLFAIAFALLPRGIAAWSAAGVVLLLWLFVLSFFRNPRRSSAAGADAVISAADGKLTDIEMVEREEFIDGPATRIGVFLSVFDVHVNRAPVSGRVAYLQYRKGTFISALKPHCRETNECQSIGIELDDGRRVLVRQIAGQIARRIVCPLRVGERIERGFDFGMIRFGSRTEVSVSAPDGWRFETSVRPGDRVRGGSTVLGEWRRS